MWWMVINGWQPFWVSYVFRRTTQAIVWTSGGGGSRMTSKQSNSFISVTNLKQFRLVFSPSEVFCGQSILLGERVR